MWTALGLSQEAFMRYLPAERMRLHREHHPQPPVQRRPVSRELTAAELASIADLPLHERRTKGREMQHSPAPRPDGA